MMSKKLVLSMMVMVFLVGVFGKGVLAQESSRRGRRARRQNYRRTTQELDTRREEALDRLKQAQEEAQAAGDEARVRSLQRRIDRFEQTDKDIDLRRRKPDVDKLEIIDRLKQAQEEAQAAGDEARARSLQRKINRLEDKSSRQDTTADVSVEEDISDSTYDLRKIEALDRLRQEQAEAIAAGDEAKVHALQRRIERFERSLH